MKRSLVVFLLVASPFSASCSAKPCAPEPGVLARLNGRTITREEVGRWVTSSMTGVGKYEWIQSAATPEERARRRAEVLEEGAEDLVDTELIVEQATKEARTEPAPGGSSDSATAPLNAPLPAAMEYMRKQESKRRYIEGILKAQGKKDHSADDFRTVFKKKALELRRSANVEFYSICPPDTAETNRPCGQSQCYNF